MTSDLLCSGGDVRYIPLLYKFQGKASRVPRRRTRVQEQLQQRTDNLPHNMGWVGFCFSFAIQCILRGTVGVASFR